MMCSNGVLGADGSGRRNRLPITARKSHGRAQRDNQQFAKHSGSFELARQLRSRSGRRATKNLHVSMSPCFRLRDHLPDAWQPQVLTSETEVVVPSVKLNSCAHPVATAAV